MQVAVTRAVGGERGRCHSVRVGTCVEVRHARRNPVPLGSSASVTRTVVHQRGLAVEEWRGTRGMRRVAMRAKGEDIDAFVKKRLKKVVRKAVEESLAQEIGQLKYLARKLKEEREALASLVEVVQEKLVEVDEKLLVVDSSPSAASLPPAERPAPGGGTGGPRDNGGGGRTPLEDSMHVTEDIMGAISRVGFPDSFGGVNGDGIRREDAQGDPGATALASKGVATGTKKEAAVGKKGKTVTQMPSVTVGCDSIQLMSLLHAKLEERGFYCTDEEREDWYFGESTQNSVMAFQASNGLTENGTVTAKEWAILLENEVDFVWEEVDEEGIVADLEAASTSGQASVEEETPVGEKEAKEAGSGASPPLNLLDAESFPMLREGDGGRYVRLLQLALDKKGFCVSDDELEFWMFGDTTETALKTFQACSGVPESGVVDEEVWSMLCEGLEDEVCSIEFLEERTNGVSEAEEADPYNIDRADGKGVFLLGEGRYEDPDRLQS